MTHRDQKPQLLVVESDQPRIVTMWNSLGCSLGTWEFREWCQRIGRGDIIIQIGDKFTFGE